MWPDFSEEILYALLKAKSMKGKIDKLKLIKIKNCSAKGKLSTNHTLGGNGYKALT